MYFNGKLRGLSACMYVCTIPVRAGKGREGIKVGMKSLCKMMDIDRYLIVDS